MKHLKYFAIFVAGGNLGFGLGGLLMSRLTTHAGATHLGLGLALIAASQLVPEPVQDD